MSKYQYSPIAFHLNNGAQMLAPITPDGKWFLRSTGPIYASTESKLDELVDNKSTGLVTVEAGIATVFGGFAGWATARPAAAPKAPAPKADAPKAPTPFMDAARAAASKQAKVKAADAPRTPAQTSHMLRLCLDQGFATLSGEMAGNLEKRAKAAQTALRNYTESCQYHRAPVDPLYGEAVKALVAAIAKRLAAG